MNKQKNTVEEIIDQIIKETIPIKAFVLDWLHETGYDKSDIIDSLEFTDIFELIRLYSQSCTANLEAQNKELIELLRRSYEVIDVAGNTRLVENIGKAIK